MRKLLILSIFLSLLNLPQVLASDGESISEGHVLARVQIEKALAYLPFRYMHLEDSFGEKGIADIIIDKSGVGYLQSSSMHQGISEAEKKSTNGIFDKFEVQTTFKLPGCLWRQLTFEDAQKAWNEPVERDGYYTFSAYNVKAGEKNIFHLDMIFDGEHTISACRVRGIGISKPCWVGANPEKVASLNKINTFVYER